MTLVIFTIADKEYGIDINQVYKVITVNDVTTIPDSAECVEGVINLRDGVIPIISLRKKLKMKRADLNKMNRVIVVKFNNKFIGVIVDRVSEILPIQSSNIIEPDELLKEAKYLIGVGRLKERLILIIDIERLMSIGERTDIEEVNKKLSFQNSAMCSKACMDDSLIVKSGEIDSIEHIERKKTVRMLSFTLAGENYCVDMKDAMEVVRPSEITRVPNTPEFIVGVMNLRGEIVPIIDIRYFFGLREIERTKDVRVIVTDVNGALMGALVDNIKEIRDIDETSIQPPLLTIKGNLTDYTKGQVQLDKEILVLLDMEKILCCEDMERFKKGEE